MLIAGRTWVVEFERLGINEMQEIMPVAPPAANPPAACPVTLLVPTVLLRRALIYEHQVAPDAGASVIGSTAMSLGVLLGTFMGGMCLGSLLLPRLISTSRHPLRVYALLELAIGVMAIGLLYFMPYIEQIYTAGVGHGTPSVLLRCACMGGFVPVAANPAHGCYAAGDRPLGRVHAKRRLLARFLLRWQHHRRCVRCRWQGFTWWAIHMRLSQRIRRGRDQRRSLDHDEIALHPIRGEIFSTRKIVALLRHASGSAWLSFPSPRLPSAEVVWTRLLSLTLGATVYTFSIILAVFLFGLGIGSSIGAMTFAQHALVLGARQLLRRGRRGTQQVTSLPYLRD